MLVGYLLLFIYGAIFSNCIKDFKHSSSAVDINLTVSAQIIKFFEDKGIKNVYEVPGGPLDAFWSEYFSKKDKQVSYVNSANELIGAFMAQAYGKFTRKPGVFFATTGPGLATALSGVFDASYEYRPLIVVTTMPKDVDMRSWQNLDPCDPMRKMAKAVFVVEDKKNLLAALEASYNAAMHGIPADPYPGCVLLVFEPSLFTQVVGKAYDPKEFKPLVKLDKVNKEKAKEFIKAFKLAKRPLVVLGEGVLIEEQKERFDKLFKNVPFISGYRVRGTCNIDSSNYLGRPGSLGNHLANYAAYHSDCVIEVGSVAAKEDAESLRNRFSNATYSPQTKVLIISPLKLLNMEPCLGKKEQVDIFVREFFDLLEVENFSFGENLKMWKKELANASRKLKPTSKLSKGKQINLEDAVLLIKDNISGVYTTGVGNHWYQAGKTLEGKDVKNFFTSIFWASIGVGIPYGMGLSDAMPDEQVVVIEGDGGFYWGISSLAVLGQSHYKNRKLKIFIMRDSKYSAVEQDSMKYKGKSEIYKLDQYNYINYQHLCKAFDINYRCAENKKNLVKVLKDIKNIEAPVLVEVTIDKSTLYEINLDKHYLELLKKADFAAINNYKQVPILGNVCN